MGDYEDHRGRVMPAPGNGRPKRARLDKNDNLVTEDVYMYPNSNATAATSIRTSFTGSQYVTGAAIATSSLHILDGTTAPATVSVLAGEFYGQIKRFTCINDTNACTVSTASPLLSYRLERDQCLTLLWDYSNGWVIAANQFRTQRTFNGAGTTRPYRYLRWTPGGNNRDLRISPGTYVGEMCQIVIGDASTGTTLTLDTPFVGGAAVQESFTGENNSITLTWMNDGVNAGWVLQRKQIPSYAFTTGASVLTKTLPTGDATAAELTNVLKQLLVDLNTYGVIGLTVTP